MIRFGRGGRSRHKRQLVGHWRWIYVVTAMIALYLNVFVLIVQLFEKILARNALAPTQTEPPFKFTQLIVLALFVLLCHCRGDQVSHRTDPYDLNLKDTMEQPSPKGECLMHLSLAFRFS